MISQTYATSGLSHDQRVLLLTIVALLFVALVAALHSWVMAGAPSVAEEISEDHEAWAPEDELLPVDYVLTDRGEAAANGFLDEDLESWVWPL